MRRVRYSAAAAAVLSLGACLDGGDPDAPAGPTYVTWTNSANGEVIKDATNENFRVRASDRVVVFDGNGRALGGTYVDTSANLFLNNTPIGGVYYTTATNGSQITVFRCTNGRALDFYNTAPDQYTYQCV